MQAEIIEDQRLVAAKARLTNARADAATANDALEAARDRAIKATCDLRDLEFAITQDLLGKAHPRFPRAVEEKAQAIAALQQARAINEHAKAVVESESTTLAQVTKSLGLEQRDQLAQTHFPELVAEVERAQALQYELSKRGEKHGGKLPTKKEEMTLRLLARAALDKLDEAMKELETA